jgi:hypothetical protein
VAQVQRKGLHGLARLLSRRQAGRQPRQQEASDRAAPRHAATNRTNPLAPRAPLRPDLSCTRDFYPRGLAKHVECLVKIVDDVLDSLDSHGHSNQSIRDSKVGTLPGRQGAMG